MTPARTSTLIVYASIAAMIAACLLPAVQLSAGGNPLRGWGAAYYSAAGIRFFPQRLSLICALGFIANITYLFCLTTFLLRRLKRLDRPTNKTLARLSALGVCCALASAIWLLPATLQFGAFLWILSQLLLIPALYLDPQPQPSRGFQVLLAKPILPVAASAED